MNLNRSNRIYRFHASAQRLRTAQLRDGSIYTKLRTLVPVVALTTIWLFVNRKKMLNIDSLLDRSTSVRHLLLAFAIVAIWNVWLSFSLYSSDSIRKDLGAEIRRIISASCCCGLVLLIANLVRGMWGQGLLLAELTASGFLFISLMLLGCFALLGMLSPRLFRSKLILIVGSGPRAVTLRSRLQRHYRHFTIIGCIDDEYVGHDITADAYLGSLDLLAGLLKSEPIEIVMIGLPFKSKYAEIERVIHTCELVGVESHYMQDMFDTTFAKTTVHSQEPRHFAVLSTVKPDPKQYLKRLFDIVASLILLLAVSPVLVIAALAVKLTSAGPVLFVQQRYGRSRKCFPMLKFRSMVFDAEKQQAALESRNEAQGPVFKMMSDPRVTKVGTFLRKTSIDELPQLFNVLRGEMSLVGPRPLPLRDVSRFDETWLLRRFSVRPGLTCLWQVTGRSNTSFDYWITQDLRYIDNWSLGLDIKILLKTIPAVLKGSGAV